MTRAEEAFEASFPPPTLAKTLLKQDGEPVFACTIEPETFMGAGPTPTPIPTPIPTMSLVDAFDAGCVATGSLDRFQKNPAFVGTNVGIGSMVDGLYQGLPAIPDTPVTLPYKAAVSVAEFVRDTIATPYNFLCQQVKKEGTYYDILPIDLVAHQLVERWNGMTTVEKAGTVIVGLMIVEAAVLLAIPK